MNANALPTMLVSHLWQATVMAVGASLLGLALHRYRPAVRFRIWLAASLQFLFPLALLVDLGRALPRIRPATDAAAWSSSPLPDMQHLGAALIAPASNAVASGANRAAGVSNWIVLLLAVWACGALVVLTIWLCEWLRIHALVRRATPLDLGLPVRTVSGSARIELGVLGVLRPVLFVPEGLPQALSEAQLRAVLAHELYHVRRRDNLWAALHMLVRAVFWFHPLVWWLGRRMMQDRELACDEGALRQCPRSEEYARGLLKVCEIYTSAPAACMAGVSGSDLKQRVLWIASGALAPALGARMRCLVGLFAAAAITTPLAAGMLLGPRQASAQSSVPAAAETGFEAASIRPADTSGRVHHYGFKIEPNRLTVEYFNVVSLLEEAYQLQDYQIRLSPAGKNKKAVEQLYAYQPFDIQAVTAAPVSESEMRARLGKLLANRFHVVSHWETEAMPMYRLEVLPGGIRLKKADAGYPDPNSPFGGGRGTCVLEFQGPMSMPQVAGMVTKWITEPKPVVDHTRAQGFFEMEMKFQRPGCVPTAGGVRADSPTGALKSIGLELTPARDPIKVLVVDRVGPVEATGQGPAPAATAAPKFQVVSIKPAGTGPASGASTNLNFRFVLEPNGRVSLEDSLRDLLETAFHVDQTRLIGLPDWAKTARYAIDAEPPDGTPALTGSENMQRYRGMLRALLADRFQLVSHRKSRRMPVYEIVIARGGSKFPPPSPPGQPPPTVGIMNPKDPRFAPQPGPGEISMGIAGMPGLVAALGMHLGRPVIDKTGINGDYDIHLVWQPEPDDPLTRFAKSAPAGSKGPSLFTALHDQLGLQVRAAKDPVDIVVVDHIARPSAN